MDPLNSTSDDRPQPAAPDWAERAAKEIHAQHWHGLTYAQMLSDCAAIILKHAPAHPVASPAGVEVLGHRTTAEWCKAVDEHHAATELELARVKASDASLWKIVSECMTELGMVNQAPSLMRGEIQEWKCQVGYLKEKEVKATDRAVLLQLELDRLRAQQPVASGEVLREHIRRCCAILGTIRTETRPVAGHDDPGALEDCWREAFDELVMMEEAIAAVASGEVKEAILRAVIDAPPSERFCPRSITERILAAVAPFLAGGEDTKTELIKALREYIAYLHEADTMTLGYLHTHNWKYPQELLDRGDRLRQIIADKQAAIAAARSAGGEEGT